MSFIPWCRKHIIRFHKISSSELLQVEYCGGFFISNTIYHTIHKKRRRKKEQNLKQESKQTNITKKKQNSSFIYLSLLSFYCQGQEC